MLVFSQIQAEVSNVIDYYFDQRFDYYEQGWYGKTSKGNDYDMCDSFKNTATPGDKITSITTYSNNAEYIKGIKINYLYAGEETAGNTNGSGSTKSLAGDEFITGWRFYKKSEGSISRIRLYTNLGNELYFGSSNGWDKSIEISEIAVDRILVGLYGTAASSKIWSIAPCYTDRFDLEFQSIDIDTSQIALENQESMVIADRAASNNTSVTQPRTVSLAYSVGESSTDSWSDTKGVEVSMGVTVTSGIKAGAVVEASSSVSWSLSETVSFSETVGGEASTDNTTAVTDSITLNVPANEVYAVREVLYYGTAEIPYTTVFTNPYDNKEFSFTGVVEQASFSKGYTQYLDIGDIDSDGNVSIDEEYQEWYEFPTFTASSQARSVGGTGQEVVEINNTNDDSQAEEGVVYTNDLNISNDDPNWIMSDEELEYRQSLGY